MSVRTYNPSVRVGNWNEDIQLEEDKLKDFLAKRERGELLIQRTSGLRDAVGQKIELGIARCGMVNFGDTVMLVNPQPKDGSRGESSISMLLSQSALLGKDAGGPCNVSASSCAEPSAKNTFIITSVDGSPPGSTLKYGQPFSLCLASNPVRNFMQGHPVEGRLFLQSDRATFFKAAKKSRHQEVTLTPQQTHLTSWKVLPFDPQIRFELEFTDVPANQKVILVHAKTNQALCVETEHAIRTPFGSESEVSAFTDLDSHKAEKDNNHFMIVMNVPGDNYRSVSPPKDAP